MIKNYISTFARTVRPWGVSVGDDLYQLPEPLGTTSSELQGLKVIVVANRKSPDFVKILDGEYTYICSAKRVDVPADNTEEAA